MCDGNGNISGVAIKELKEETGLEFKRDDLFDLGSIYPSAGGCDEMIHLFGLELDICDNKISEMKTRIYGDGEHEMINLRFIPYEKAWEL